MMINWIILIFLFGMSYSFEVIAVKKIDRDLVGLSLLFLICGTIVTIFFGPQFLAVPLVILLCYGSVIRILLSPLMWCGIGRFFWIVFEKRGYINLKKGLIIVLILVIIGGSALWIRSIFYTRATYFRDEYISQVEEGSPLIFPEIDPEEVRVTTSEIARSIAKMKRTSAAGWVTSVHLGMYNGELCWIATISDAPYFRILLVGAVNEIRELVIIPVTDATGERAFTLPFEAKYAEGLWFKKNIFVHAQDTHYPNEWFTRGYLTQNDEGELVYVTTSFYEVPFGVLKEPKVEVWDPTTGRLIATYDPPDAPEWVIQRWDERFVEKLGNSLGGFRWTEDNELNYWNGIPTSSDRAANPAEKEGLRYQRWGNETVGVYLFANKKNPSLLEFLLLVKSDSIVFYKMHHLQYISPKEAKRVAIAGLPELPKGREYFTPLALLYRIKNDVWYHIPVYVKEEEETELHFLPVYFVLVRATDRRCIRISCSDVGGMGEAVVEAYMQVKGYEEVEEVEEGRREIAGTITSISYSEESGNGRWVLEILTENGTKEYVLIRVEDLKTEEEKLMIMMAKVGDFIRVVVDENNVIYLDKIKVYPVIEILEWNKQ